MKSGTRENSAGEKRKNRTPNSAASAVMSTAEDGDVSESLSDIDDAEVAGYLNSKKAAQFKRLIWEVMNQDYEKGKSRKRARKANTAAPAKKAVKVSTVKDNEKGNSPGLEEGRESNSDMHQSNEKESFGRSLDDEFEHEDEYSGEAEVNQGYEDDDTYFEHDECNAYNYDEDYTYNEFDEF